MTGARETFGSKISLVAFCIIIYSHCVCAAGEEPRVLVLSDEASVCESIDDDQLRIGSSSGPWKGDPEDFFTGALIGLTAHEAGHLLANSIVGSGPHTESVSFAGIPFFTIEPGHELTDREHYFTAQAGFMAQHAVNEWLLEEYPNLRNEDRPLLKGLATFNFWLSVGYAASAITQYGPHERDTNGMADTLGVDEPVVGLMILTPTLLDRYRYEHPDEEWARDLSRAIKLMTMGLTLTVD